MYIWVKLSTFVHFDSYDNYLVQFLSIFFLNHVILRKNVQVIEIFFGNLRLNADNLQKSLEQFIPTR